MLWFGVVGERDQSAASAIAMQQEPGQQELKIGVPLLRLVSLRPIVLNLLLLLPAALARLRTAPLCLLDDVKASASSPSSSLSGRSSWSPGAVEWLRSHWPNACTACRSASLSCTEGCRQVPEAIVKELARTC
jgi:hypothetical protein